MVGRGGIYGDMHGDGKPVGEPFEIPETLRRSVGQVAYEDDVRRRPTYDDGSPRKSWAQLDEAARWSWERR